MARTRERGPLPHSDLTHDDGLGSSRWAGDPVAVVPQSTPSRPRPTWKANRTSLRQTQAGSSLAIMGRPGSVRSRAPTNGTSGTCPRHWSTSMAKLIYSTIASLDGYVEDLSGRFDWAAPDEEVHAFVNDLERPSAPICTGAGCTRRWSSGRRPVSPTTTPKSSGTSGGPAIPRGGAWCRYALDTPDLATFNEPALYRRGR